MTEAAFKAQWLKKSKKSQKDLIDATVKAREQGMSYGEYQSYLYLAAEEEKKRQKQEQMQHYVG